MVGQNNWRGTGGKALKVVAVESGARQDELSSVNFPVQLPRFSQIDVLGVGGKTIGNTGQEGHQFRNGGGDIGKVRVKMLNVFAQDGSCYESGLQEFAKLP